MSRFLLAFLRERFFVSEHAFPYLHDNRTWTVEQTKERCMKNNTITPVKSGLDRIFKLTENHTDVKTELFAGITTFMTMAYILAVNPSILSVTGMDAGALFTATALAACLGTLFMALFTNYPFALAPGMGLNAYFAYTIVLGMGYSWQTALAAVLVEGIIFIVLSLTNVREAIFNAIPHNLKIAVSAGIGLFIAFIGLQNANIVVSGSNMVELFSLSGYDAAKGVSASMSDVGICVVLAAFGVLLCAVLVARRVKGGILWGMLAIWVVGIVCEFVGLYVPNPSIGFYSLLPDFTAGFSVPDISPILFQFDFSNLFSLNFLIAVFSLLFVDVFDTLGGLIGVASKAQMLDENDRLPRVKGALLADACATTAGAMLGTSTVTTYAESATGISEGGRTGLTSVTVAVLFALSLFLSPIFLAIPSFATSAALIVVGFYLFCGVRDIDFAQPTEALPAYLCILAMPFLYSISEGISIAIISYVLINLCTGKRDKISIMMYVLAVLFTLRYVLML